MAKPSTKKRRSTASKRKTPEAVQAVATTETPAVAPSADVETVQLGPVAGRRQKVKVGVVCGLLGRELLSRVELLQGQPSTDAVLARMRATDGRATPVVFAAGKVENEAPTLLSGLEAVAAAMGGGVDEISVIVIPAGDVEAAQSHIVEVTTKRQQTDPEEDDYYVRVLASDEE